MSGVLRTRRVLALVLAVIAVGALSAGPAAAGGRGCVATNTTLGVTYGPDTGAALARAVAAARAGDVIEVQGVCRGSIVVAADISLVGRWTAAVPVTTLVGRAGQPTVAVPAGARLTMTRLLVTHPSGDTGPGVLNGGTLTLFSSTVRGNTGTDGGGVSSTGTLAVQRSTITENTAERGGGLFTTGRATVATSTVSGNTSNGDGGGIAVGAGTLRLSYSTVGRNTAQWIGGGLDIDSSAAVVLEASVLGGNQAGASGSDCAGPAVSNGYVVMGTTDGWYCEIVPTVGDQIDAPEGILDVALEALAWNGGPTQTMALRADSPALDAIPVGARGADGRTVLCAAGVSLDQRRVVRPIGAGCDVGAFEE